ncbi:MarR family winged helix-turn-helix transcriptional regulator [Cupriavidus neocaledonicus]|uniref:MarR family transcriptional regulator n=1 Tax=Cupriavidus neocaledonicus TaxID=1040979 RepID=A0A375HP49_9BURK|nr:MarR family winged helix-turn-helix transcriptional regulator [Cupriavidus neocaledonicus]SOZ37867.1 Putative transcription regulator, MarR family [Cupriavidus neocaledonicus]SPD58624.1 MarR family transcriptional regulator [Cupriavidus neocaledonicus]
MKPLPRLEQFLSYRLHQVNKLSDKDSAAAYLEQCGLLLSEGRCLAAIGAFAPLSVNALAQRANLTKGQASRSAQALVARGLVSKEASAADGRGVVLSLTAQGRPLYRQAIAMIARRNEEIFGCLSEAEQALLGDLLDRLVAHAGQQDGEGPDDDADA